jgi:hypothetical protein
MIPRTSLFPVISLLGVACLPDLPEESSVEDLRVLGVRAVPAMPTGDGALRAAFSPGESVDLESFVVGPSGPFAAERLAVRWLLCDLAADQLAFGCIDAWQDGSVSPECPSDGATALSGPCVLAETPAPRWRLSPPPADDPAAVVGVVLVANEIGDGTIDRCSDALAEGDYDTPNACRYATYRLERARSGMPPNLHPLAPTVEVDVGRGDERRPLGVVPAGATLEITDAEELSLRPTWPDADEQVYAVPINDGEGTANVDETIRARWFQAGGELVGSDLPAVLDDDPNEIWRPQAAGVGHVFLVLADGRGGLSWWWSEITVRPE